MNVFLRIVPLILSGSSALCTSAQVEIVLDPADGKAEIISGGAEESKDGVRYSTRLPNGEVKEGIWDVNPDDTEGDLIGIRILDLSDFINEPVAENITRIRIMTQRGAAKYPAHYAVRVPERFVSESTEDLELAWYLYDQSSIAIGTVVADEDTDSLQAFTETKDGKIRTGLWEENRSGKPLYYLGTAWPFRIERMADGVIEFVLGAMVRSSTHAPMSEDYLLHNTGLDTLEIKDDNDKGDANRGPTFELNITTNSGTIDDVSVPSIGAANAAALDNMASYIELYFEFLFSESTAVIPVTLLYDDLGTNAATTQTPGFFGFLPDIRVVMRDQAFFDFEDDDEDLYSSTIPFQAGNDFIRYIGAEGVVIPPYTTKYVLIPFALKDQVGWFDQPQFTGVQSITINRDLSAVPIPNAKFSMDLREHGVQNGVGNYASFLNLEVVLLHEICHVLGLTSRGNAITDLTEDGFVIECDMFDLGQSAILPGNLVTCENWVYLIDIFRFYSSALPFASSASARSASRVFELVSDQSVLLAEAGSVSNGDAVQMAVGQSLVNNLYASPQPGHLRAYNLQTQQVPHMASSIGLTAPGINLESMRPYGNPPIDAGEYIYQRRLSRYDLRLLDILGWNIDPAADIMLLPVSRPVTQSPMTNELVEPDFDIAVNATNPAIRQFRVYSDAASYEISLVGTVDIDQFGIGMSALPLTRGQEYYGYYIEEDVVSGLVESEQITLRIRCTADQNSDGMVSPADFSAWTANFNAMDPRADTNYDGMLTPADFSAWVAAFNAGC
jgi:hypothetical protein